MAGAGKNRLRALDGITLDLGRGETLGLVGESGCGKSTLARALLMLERPDSQMVFQDPYASLNARMSAGDIIAEPWRTHKALYTSRSERETRVRELLDLVGLRARDADRHPQEFSGWALATSSSRMICRWCATSPTGSR